MTPCIRIQCDIAPAKAAMAGLLEQLADVPFEVVEHFVGRFEANLGGPVAWIA